MDNEESQFRVGYGKPPRHTRFKPGQSGNPNGRPKRKATTLLDAFFKELNTRITVTEGGKQRKITKLDAIVKQQTNKAIQGDHKAASLVMKAVEPRDSDGKGTLSPVLEAMLAIHEKHEIANQKGTRARDGAGLAGNVAGVHTQADDDET